MELPGPGHYKPDDYKNGSYLLSTFQSKGTRRMVPDNMKSSVHKIKRVTPGPGHYQPPSDFGYLNLFKYSPRTSQSPRH